MSAGTLSYEGCNFLRQRLVLATLCGKSVKIKRIRSKDDNPGIRDFEASLIRLLDKLTNGSVIEVNETGTTLFYQPGILIGGEIVHDCNTQKSIGYYLEVLLCLAPFTKEPVKATLDGVTNDKSAPSVDVFRLSAIPVLKKFLGTDEDLELKVVRRGASPEGGGRVLFTCPSRHKLRPLHFIEPGKIKRIRGVAWTCKVSPATANRIVDTARSVLNKCLPDIYIYTDHQKGGQAVRSPGFGLTLVAESTNGVFLCAECCSNPRNSEQGPTVPEDLGKEAALLLLDEIYRGGCVDSSNQGFACLFMVLGQRDVSKVQMGPLSDYTIQYLRHIKEFFNVTFKVDNEITDEEDSTSGGDKYILTCVGVGFTNRSKRIM